jgi:hypothetical protein
MLLSGVPAGGGSRGGFEMERLARSVCIFEPPGWVYISHLIERSCLYRVGVGRGYKGCAIGRSTQSEPTNQSINQSNNHQRKSTTSYKTNTAWPGLSRRSAPHRNNARSSPAAPPSRPPPTSPWLPLPRHHRPAYTTPARAMHTPPSYTGSRKDGKQRGGWQEPATTRVGGKVTDRTRGGTRDILVLHMYVRYGV